VVATHIGSFAKSWWNIPLNIKFIYWAFISSEAQADARCMLFIVAYTTTYPCEAG